MNFYNLNNTVTIKKIATFMVTMHDDMSRNGQYGFPLNPYRILLHGHS